MAAAASSAAGSSVSSAYDASEEKTNGTRLARLLIDGGTLVLRNFLHSIYPPATLQHVLNNNRIRLSRRVKFDDQLEKLFPSSGDPPDSETFDITLLHFLIREICCLTAPAVTGWHKMPAEDDESLEAHITRIKCFRDELCHVNSTGVPNDEFEKKWKQISSSLEALEPYAYRRRIERLKNDPIDHDIQRRVEEQVNQWAELDTELARYETEQETIKVPSCLPDELPEQLMFGRTQEIQQVTEAIQSGSVSIVWITGGPGFGKTTVASKAAHELSKPENDRTVLFCSLRSKKTFNDAATLMALTCSKNQTQPPGSPQHWLLNWSKQQMSNVTFVLDNADHVLEDLEDSDCNEFMNLLEEMRTLSVRQYVTFIITTRKAYSTASLQTKIVRLAPLPADQAKQILLSRLPDQENRNKLSKVEKIVELCGFVPLALCIAGSLLSEAYNEDEFIQSLEEEPSDVLQVGRRSTDQNSVEKSIKSSFEVLDELEQKALILLCTFPGSFNSDAAKSLITDCTTIAKSVSIILELRERSLVEQLRPRRYQVHQLIQTFVQKIALNKYPDLLNQGKKLACAHFMSRLTDNANLYWCKDTCKQSVDSFNEDRNNFEYFLQVYAEEMNNHDPYIVEATKAFLKDLPQKCMYLERCILPSLYKEMLEHLLQYFKSVNQPVHTVVILCLLGHECRKVGHRQRYDTLMEEAIKLYSEWRSLFSPEALSEVIYLSSYARFLSENKIPDEPKNLYDMALRLCREKLPNHPEAAATMLFVGRCAKRRKEYGNADEKFNEALELLQECLGEHFVTALCLKDIADLNLHTENTESDLEKSLSYYKEALRMMERLGMDGHKESIMTLKNCGVCHIKKGNFEEGRIMLERAERVAERELEEDHMWKVMVKTELALLYDEVGNEDQMEAAMKEGLEMCFKLGHTIERLGNKHLIRKTLNRFPDIFPNDQYPR